MMKAVIRMNMKNFSLQFLVIMLYLAFYRISDPCDDACYINGNVLGKRSSLLKFPDQRMKNIYQLPMSIDSDISYEAILRQVI